MTDRETAEKRLEIAIAAARTEDMTIEDRDIELLRFAVCLALDRLEDEVR